MKVCTKCNIEKDESEFYVHKIKGRCGKLFAACISCCKLIQKERNSTQIGKAYRRNYTLKNIEAVKNRVKKYAKLDKYKKIKAKASKKWYLKNKETYKKIVLQRGNDYRINLSNGYIKERLIKQGFTKDLIKNNPDIIESKKITLKINRHVKTKQKAHH